MNCCIFRGLGCIAGFAVVLMATPGANAQSSDPGQIEEIVVTVQKITQRLQDVPLSVTAVTGEQLRARDVTTLEDLQYSIPGLSAFEYGPGTEYIQIRGISNANGSPTVGTYLDEMPVSSTVQARNIDVRLLDMERVEVLRGPQGTLYGEGSMGGTVRYITASPDLTQLSGRVELEGGSITDGSESYKGDAVVNVPLAEDRFGVRLVAGYERDGGWIDSLATGRQNVNGVTVKTVRGKFLIEPADDTHISLLVLHQNTDQDYQPFGLNGVTASAVPTYDQDRYDLVNGIVTQEFASTHLVESLGYVDHKTSTQYDETPYYLAYLEAPPPYGLGVPPGYITRIGLAGPTEQRTLTNETRLSSSGTGPLNWTGGFYYRHADYQTTADTTTAPGALPVTLLSSDYGQKDSAAAVFGEANYQFTQELNALVGLRYYEDRPDFDADSVSFGFPATDRGSAKFHSVDPRFNLRYEFSTASMLYANVAKGFRSGGFNLTSSGAGVVKIPPTYAPDSLWTYEGGTKQQLFGRTLEVEVAVYYTKWKDVQSSFYAPGSAITVIENGGRVSGWGNDTSVTWHMVSGLSVSGSFGWNELAYDTSTADKLRGDPVDFAAHQTASASLDYRHRVFAATDGFFRADYQHAGEARITLRDFGNQIVSLPARDMVNFRAGLDLGGVEVYAFANNVFNDTKPIIVGPFGVVTENLEQRPRTVGLGVRASFQ